MSFSRSTTATRVNSSGLIEVVPRNLLTYSNALNNGVWATNNVTKTSGQVSPTSSNNEGWLLNKTSPGVDGLVANYFLISSLNKYTYSWYILKDTNESRFPEFFLRINGGQVEQYVQLNTKTGALGVRVASSGCTRSITLSSDGLWWRLTLTNPAPTATTGDNRHGVRPAAGTTLGVYNINATGSVIVYGAQTEAGVYATSYIPTTSSTVTRNADVISKTGISSLIGQTEGTIFGEIKLETVNSNNSIAIGVTDGLYNGFLIGKQGGVSPNKFLFYGVYNGTEFINNTSIPLSTNFVKFALAYKSGDWAIYLNGSIIQSGTTVFTFSSPLNRSGFGWPFNLSSIPDKIEVKSMQLYKTRLSNSELAQLTSL